MNIAVFSDIHSNVIALDACIEDIENQQIDGIIFLGDNVSDCPLPQDTLSRIRELDRAFKTWHIKGNREDYFVQHADGAGDGWCYSSYKGSLLYTYEHLTKEDIECFRNYKGTRKITIPETESITIAHGSPASLRELLYPDGENTKCYLDQIDTKYLLCGHTHKQGMFKYKDKLFINPGSIGVAIGGRAVAHYAVLSWNNSRWNCCLKEVPFDLEALRRRFYSSSLMEKAYVWPKCILKSLETGINMGPLCAKAAMDLAELECGEGAAVTESYWRRAAKSLDII